MAARTISELANWDGRLDQKRQNAKRDRSSSIRARDPYHTPLSPETSRPSSTFSEKKRAEKSSFHSNLGRDSVASSPANTRFPSRVDTTPTPLRDVLDDRHRSVSHTLPRLALPSPSFTTLPISSPSSPVLSVPSRLNNSRTSPGLVASSPPASTLESEVIDLTLEDTEDELSDSKKSVPNTVHPSNRTAGPVPRSLSSSSARSSPILPEQSLFTPPPLPRRTRLFIDYLQVPPFPDGLTKADYRSISHYHGIPLPGPSVSNMAAPTASSESTRKHTHSPQKPNGKERECDTMSSQNLPAPTITADVLPYEVQDTLYEHTEIPLYNDDAYPPLTPRDLATNTRFQFAHAWRAHASKLGEAKFDWTSNLRISGKATVWARSSHTPSPRVPGTTGYVSIEHLRPWVLAPPEENPEPASDGQTQVSETRAAVDVGPDHALLQDDTLPAPDVAVGSALSDPTVSQPFSSMPVDTENDMNQYFNGLGDSPNKQIPSRQPLAPAHAFRSHSAERDETDSFEFGHPSLDLDSQLADASGNECFLGIPPSPTTADMDPSVATGLTSDSPFEPASYIAASPSNAFDGDVSLSDVWAFEQEDRLCLDDKPPCGNDVPSTTPGTINPSLLGPGQPEALPEEPVRTQKQRSKLPEPIIYVRRPVDSSAPPLKAGKRPVQIKYRDPGVSSASSSTRKPSEASSSHTTKATESSTSDTDEPLPTKRRPVPSRKLREARSAPESESDYTPGTSRSNIKIKIKRPNLEEKGTNAQYQGAEDEGVPTMSYCHQCRNKSVRPKMSCSNMIDGRVCGKRFCNRCVLFRYPDITFDEYSAGFLCPVCTNTCNCSFCSRNRGEEFVSMRLGGLAASIFKSKVTLVRDSAGPLHNSRSLDKDKRRDTGAAPAVEASQSHFWAHVYGVEGERVGSAFMRREHMERLHAPSNPTSISALPLLALPEAQSQSQRGQKVPRPRRRDEPIGPRVFIGQPLASWKVRSVRDLEPSVSMDVVENTDEMTTGKGKGRARGCRWYIGNPTALHEPYGRMPGSGMASPTSGSRCSTPDMCSETPLSDLAGDNWPQPEVGECCEWAPGGVGMGIGALDSGGLSGLFSEQGSSGSVGPESATGVVHTDEGSTTFSEQDLARAISAALAALDVEPSCLC